MELCAHDASTLTMHVRQRQSHVASSPVAMSPCHVSLCRLGAGRPFTPPGSILEALGSCRRCPPGCLCQLRSVGQTSLVYSHLHNNETCHVCDNIRYRTATKSSNCFGNPVRTGQGRECLIERPVFFIIFICLILEHACTHAKRME